jgi:hypothetical protein
MPYKLFLISGLLFLMSACSIKINGYQPQSANVQGLKNLFDGNINALAAEDSRSLIYVGGAFQSIGSQPAPYFARLDIEGERDNSFNMGSGFDGVVNSIAMANDSSGDVYVAGAFQHYNGSSAAGVARLLSSGSLDVAFGISNPVQSILVSPDNSELFILSAGQVSVYSTSNQMLLSVLAGSGVTAIAMDSNGGLYMGTSSGMIQYMPFSQLPPSPLVSISSSFGNISALVVDSTHIIVGASSGALASVSSISLAGVPVWSVPLNPVLGQSASIDVLYEDSLGNIYVGASNVQNEGGLFRIANGMIDSTFAANGEFGSGVLAIVDAPEVPGAVILGGSFQTINGQTSNNLSRVLVSGEIDINYTQY